jgi:hypothetical protein
MPKKAIRLKGRWKILLFRRRSATKFLFLDLTGDDVPGCYGDCQVNERVSSFFLLLKVVLVFFWLRFLFVGQFFPAPGCYPHANDFGAR